MGVATCDEMGLTTTSLYTLRRRSLDKDLDRLTRTASERDASRIVVGLPLSMDGSESERTSRTRDFARALARKTSIPVLLWDERLSTFEAENILRKSKVHWKKRKDLVDQVAAEVILRSYLDADCPSPTPSGPAFEVNQEQQEG